MCVSTADNDSQQLVKARPNNVLHSSSVQYQMNVHFPLVQCHLICFYSFTHNDIVYDISNLWCYSFIELCIDTCFIVSWEYRGLFLY